MCTLGENEVGIFLILSGQYKLSYKADNTTIKLYNYVQKNFQKVIH